MGDTVDIIKLTLDENNYCKICLFGATIISWINEGEEYLFLSSNVKFDNKTAIRGGIPIIFPCFGPWSYGPQHGFARISNWELFEKPQIIDDYSIATISLKWNDDTLKMWNVKFLLKLTVSLNKNSLTTKMEVFNEDLKDFDFTFLFHTYLKTPNINNVKIEGLKGSQIINKISNKEEFEERDAVTIDRPVDSIYKSTSNVHTINTGHRSLKIFKENLPDTVIWNPWREKALTMGDLGEEYKQMVCVEAGCVIKPITISPAGNCSFTQEFTII